MVTKCNDYVLYCGMQVSCRVMDIKEKSASLSVEGTYRGSAFIGNMADYKVGSIYEVLKVGAIKTGVVIGFDRERLQVDVSFKESHLAHSESWWMRERYRDELMAKWWDASDRAKIPFDKFFLEEAALAEYDAATTISKETTAVVQPRSQMTNRLVYHPLFENCTFQQAVNSLRERGVGSVLFRPSSKGPNHISITWAFQEGIFKHIDVVECNKRPGDLGLSSELEITVGHNVKEVFSDLDDIYSGYIQPMNEFTKMITDSSFFFRGPMDQLHAALQLEFQKKPGRTPYFLSVSPTDVGCFLLSWLSLNGPKSIPVVITCKVTPC
jgi:predicted RNA-binding protein with RPS1 domain